jgi:nucleoid-associated protein YgaU
LNPAEGGVNSLTPRKKRGGGGVAIALVTLLMLLGGFGYAIYRRIQKSKEAEVVQAENPPDSPTAGEGELKTPAPEIAPVAGVGDPAPAAPAIAEQVAPPAQAEPGFGDDPLLANNEPAGDPLLDAPTRREAIPEIPQEIPDFEPAVPAVPNEIPETPALAALPEELPDEMKTPDDLPDSPPAELPPEISLETPAAQPRPEPQPEPQPELALELPPQQPLEEPAPVSADSRMGGFEPEAVDDSPATVTTPRRTQALPPAVPMNGRDPRFGDYEPDVPVDTTQAAPRLPPATSEIEMVGNEEFAPSTATAAETTIIQPRRPLPAATLELEPLPTSSALAEEPLPGATAQFPNQPNPQRPVTAPAPQAPAGVYTVAPNDNFWQISKTVYGSARPFKALSKHFEQFGLQPHQLRPGMQLAIPPRAQLEAQYPTLIDRAPSAFQGPGATLGGPTSAVEPAGQPEFSARSNLAATPAGATYDPQPGQAIPVSAAQPQQAAAVYTVQPNDNFWQISKNVYGTARLFKALTAHFEQQGLPSQRLRAGMQLPMPSRGDLEARFAALIDNAPAAIQQAGAGGSPVLARGREMSSSPTFSGRPVVVGPELGAPDVMSLTAPSLGAPEDDGAGDFFVGDQGRPMYKVGSDDTLTSIAQRHLGRASRWNEIFELNKNVMSTPDRMRPGLVLELPGDASNISRADSPMVSQ